jgi:hypothetical protein
MIRSEERITQPRYGGGMVDRINRNEGLKTLRDLLDGRITNDEFINRFPRAEQDPALAAILQATWMQFSDRRTHKLTGRDSPAPELRVVLERCCAFLSTNLEFQWPPSKARIGKGLLQLVGLGRPLEAADNEYKSAGDFDVWPFLERSDYEASTKSTESCE